MEKMNCSRKAGPRSAVAAWVLVLLLVVCLAESATGSCLSYGHSCWGAHGKRSGRPPVSTQDMYLTRLLRRMISSSNENNPARQMSRNDDTNAIYQLEVPDDSPPAQGLRANEDASVDNILTRNIEAKPMLDDELLSKIKLWQMMKEASDK
ncbi:neuropeptide CCHamide-1 isoform X2 [Plodia interpunctella]|uniref:neuropeptide CCHamide-1 isoform X2 n=1 Tax=Plodia interpunctella TaxID=58824 RepID=UPI002368A2BF|nr:neuropeptide CCHamide-1 isoform X2 [Plodia interpunctella]